MQRGAQQAELEALYRERFGAFVLTMTATLRNEEAALDVVQEAFALALRRRRSFRNDGTLEAWLWRITINLARDRWRRSKRELESPRADEVACVDSEFEGDLRSLLLTLPERQRLAVFLRYYADLSYAQIAALLGVEPGTVAASLNAAHRALRRTMAEGVSG